ncbi:MAG TPA: hypothetical protein VJH23_00615 [archaeon]|nr:hypothetical protein [archaeon]
MKKVVLILPLCLLLAVFVWSSGCVTKKDNSAGDLIESGEYSEIRKMPNNEFYLIMKDGFYNTTEGYKIKFLYGKGWQYTPSLTGSVKLVKVSDTYPYNTVAMINITKLPIDTYHLESTMPELKQKLIEGVAIDNNQYTNYKSTGIRDIKLGQIDAFNIDFEYSADIDKNRFAYIQTGKKIRVYAFVQNGYSYEILYGAEPDLYSNYLTEADQMMKSFEIFEK